MSLKRPLGAGSSAGGSVSACSDTVTVISAVMSQQEMVRVCSPACPAVKPVQNSFISGRYAVPQVYERGEREFRLGKGIVAADGGDVCIIANGILVSAALEARALLKNEGGTLTLVRDEPFDFDLSGEQVW